MKLVVSYLAALRTYVTRQFYYVMTDLIANHGWQHIETNDLWFGKGNVKDRLLARFGELPETILFWEAYELLTAHAAEINRMGCRKVVLANDLHWWNAEMRRMRVVSFALCDKVLSTCAYVWDHFYPEFCGTKPVIWIPHSASPDFLLPFNPCPENAILLSGAITRCYPLRQQLMELHSRRIQSITHHTHPGYHCGYNYTQNNKVGPGYAEAIHSHRAGFTDSSIFKYVVAKYFEIPATGALLLADDAVSRRLRELGFIENTHYLPVSKENLEERIQYVLDERNHDAVDEIRRRGQQLIWERHKISDRSRAIDEACRN
jgi:Glycosyl transferases group 1